MFWLDNLHVSVRMCVTLDWKLENQNKKRNAY